MIAHQNWSSIELLKQIPRRECLRSSRLPRDLRSIFWNDLKSEFDAHHFIDHLKNYGQTYSKAFQDFLDQWYLDEQNHAAGFAKIYSSLFEIPERSLFAKLESRAACFDHLTQYFKDEFKLCMLLAYDELATTYSYQADLELYQSFGVPALTQWNQLLKRDEAWHFATLIKLMRTLHAHRINEAEVILDEIIELDLTRQEYTGTFVLDHKSPHFSLNIEETASKYKQIILRKLQSIQ